MDGWWKWSLNARALYLLCVTYHSKAYRKCTSSSYADKDSYSYSIRFKSLEYIFVHCLHWRYLLLCIFYSSMTSTHLWNIYLTDGLLDHCHILTLWWDIVTPCPWLHGLPWAVFSVMSRMSHLGRSSHSQFNNSNIIEKQIFSLLKKLIFLILQ